MRVKRLRRRATAVVTRGGKVLLVKDRGQDRYSLPGGGIKRNEAVAAAASRELCEELGLKAVNVTRSPEYDYEGSFNLHHVCIVEASGQPRLRQLEVNAFLWWDMLEWVPILPHVRCILQRMGRL